MYTVRKENNYNYINLFQSDLRGCRGQNSFATNKYIPMLLGKPIENFVINVSTE